MFQHLTLWLLYVNVCESNIDNVQLFAVNSAGVRDLLYRGWVLLIFDTLINTVICIKRVTVLTRGTQQEV